MLNSDDDDEAASRRTGDGGGGRRSNTASSTNTSSSSRGVYHPDVMGDDGWERPDDLQTSGPKSLGTVERRVGYNT